MVSYDATSVITTSAIGLIIYIVYKVFEYIIRVRRLEKVFDSLPGPKEKHWLFGTMYGFPRKTHELLDHFVKLCNEYGSEKGYIVLWGAFGQPVIVPCSPKIMGNICKSTEPKATGLTGVYRLIKPWLGDGLLIAHGERWARNRRLLTPAFHFDILKPYMRVYNDCTNDLMRKIDGHATKCERFELFENISLCTLQIILKCAFSYEKDVQNEGHNSPYVQAVNRLTDSIRKRMTSPFLLFDIIWYMTKDGRQFKRDCDYVHAVAEDIINKRRTVLSNNEIQNKRKALDFLDILLTARDDNGAGLTDIEIRNEVDTFLFEGHDTTASSIAWILYSLAKNPLYQRKCQEEIDEILGDRDGDQIEWVDLPKFEYLNMCIKEGMRLHSPVPLVNRMTQNEFDVGDRKLPKGLIVQLNIWVLNHMEKYWPNHMDFIPERFSKENLSKIEPFQYVPFSAGPRNCIGQNFATNEEKTVLAKLLRNFNFRLDERHVVRRNFSAVMRAENGIYVYAERRKK